jgi:hypothetical protein
MNTCGDALATCTVTCGSIGGEPSPDLGASPDISYPQPPRLSARGCAGRHLGRNLRPVGRLFATRGSRAEAACRQWPLCGRHFVTVIDRSWPAAGGRRREPTQRRALAGDALGERHVALVPLPQSPLERDGPYPPLGRAAPYRIAVSTRSVRLL